jgi:hypothetical protein
VRFIFLCVVAGTVVVGTLLSCGVAPEKTQEKIGQPAKAEGLTADTTQGRETLPSPDLLPCEGAGADPWVTELRDRAMSSDMLANYADNLYGPPVSCEGAVTSEFDGSKFGMVRLGFAKGVTFSVETMAPETSIVTLRSPAGFEDKASARRALETYSASVGLRIDWTAPTETKEGTERVQSFWDPDPGVNGSASFVFLGDTLVALRFSMAL